MDLGMIRLVAKRWGRADWGVERGQELLEIQQNKGFYIPTLAEATVNLPRIPGPLGSFPEVHEALTKLEACVSRRGDLHDQSRPLSAVLADAQGRILATSVHQGSINKTLHAEVSLLQKFSREGGAFDSGMVLWTSMKPCHMCAGMIHHCGIRSVFYRRDDPGPMARGTILEKLGLQKIMD